MGEGDIQYKKTRGWKWTGKEVGGSGVAARLEAWADGLEAIRLTPSDTGVDIRLLGDTTMADAKNIIVGSSTGTKIGTATTQKLGFYNASPVAQPSAYTQTYATANKIHDNPTGAAITDSSGGTASQTIAAIYGGSTGAAATTNEPCETATKNAIASLADEVNKLINDVADVKQLVNSVIDDLQVLGFVG